MTNEKFRGEIDTLKKFFELYCHEEFPELTPKDIYAALAFAADKEHKAAICA
jgi:uncharacterized protein (DUF433 family)